MTTATENEVKTLKPETTAIVDKIIEIKGLTIAADGTNEQDPEIFEKTLPKHLTTKIVGDVFEHVANFNAAVAKVSTDQCVPHIAKNENFSAEVTVPLVRGHRITQFIEGTKETSDGHGGRQTVHGSVAAKLELRGWKAGGFGIVKQEFRQAATAALSK